jgi:hypothetical protein
VLTSLAVCLFTYGGWGLTDRARSRFVSRGYELLGGAMEAFCALLGAVGVLAAAGALLGVWAIALGTWIS